MSIETILTGLPGFTEDRKPLIEKIRRSLQQRQNPEVHNYDFRLICWLCLVLVTFSLCRSLSAFAGLPAQVVRDPFHWGHSFLVLISTSVSVFYIGNVAQRMNLDGWTYSAVMIAAALIASLAQGSNAVTLSADGFEGRGWENMAVFLGAWLFVLGVVIPEHLRLLKCKYACLNWISLAVVVPALVLTAIDFIVSKASGFNPMSRLHIHHYCWAAILGTACHLPHKFSALCQAALFGLAVQGVGVWGCDSFWPVLLNKYPSPIV